jgi:glycosyltransferase involved in cell wall biosynthesis
MFRGELVGLFPSVLRKAPATVYTVQHMADADPLWKRVFSRVTVKYKDRIIASSQAVKGALVAYTHLPAEKIEVIYNSVDFSKVEEVTHSPPNPEQPIIGTVTRLHPDKGIQYFIKAFPAIVKEFPKAQGWIIGDGEEKVKLQALAEELGIRDKIKFWGWVREPYHLLSQMSLFVFPSVTEALGIALIEALGLGVPAVASNVGGIPEVLEKKPEWLVPPCQPMELAKKSLEILCNYPQARKAAQELSRLVREKFDVKRLANQQGKLYRELVEGG